MGLVNISDIRPEMVLASPVLNSQGMLLLQQGIVLTAKHIHILKSWGIDQVDIEGQLIAAGLTTRHSPKPQLEENI